MDEEGVIRWCRHHSGHENSKTHPDVPHDHEWYIDDKGNNTQRKESKKPNADFKAPKKEKNNKQNKNYSNEIVDAIGVATIGYICYIGLKAAVATIFAVPSGGTSYIVAGVLP